MNALEDFIWKLKSLPLKEAGIEAMRDTLSEAADLNILQLENGLLADGTKIIPMYRDAGYAALKATMNPLAGAGTPDLNLTGAFYAGIEAKMNFDGIQIFSTDSKTFKLIIKYGPNIIGLSEDSKKEYVDILAPLILLRLKSHLLS